MPTEIREIIFTGEEVMVGLDYYCAKNNIKLPSNIDYHFAGSAGPVLIVEADKFKLRLGSDDLAVVMVMYCLKNKIPLPSQAHKTIQLFGDSIGLIINKNVVSHEISGFIKTD